LAARLASTASRSRAIPLRSAAVVERQRQQQLGLPAEVRLLQRRRFWTNGVPTALRKGV
jgi:hypothetical protein